MHSKQEAPKTPTNNIYYSKNVENQRQGENLEISKRKIHFEEFRYQMGIGPKNSAS